jgi:tRNA-specific 2-thiouridylase
MSGGVDSSVAAALLQEAGYEVVGVTMRIWPCDDPAVPMDEEKSCCSLAAVEDARRVARDCGFQHHAMNLRDEFRRQVIDDFVSEYRQGRTPNPCIRCNQYVRFPALLHRARQLDCEYIATGHYARVTHNEETGRWELRRGVDDDKDQSYVLYGMTQEELAHARFPLGEWTKPQVREAAAKFGLSVAERPESQDICFLPEECYTEFLEREAPELARRGPIVDLEGKVVGEHRGIIHYTVGQRRGLRMAVGEPRYVVRIDAARNMVVIGPETALGHKEFRAAMVKWVSRGYAPESGGWLTAQIRYRSPAARCLLEPVDAETVRGTFAEPQRAIAPGQSAVFYDGDRVVCGGVIAGD